MHRSSKLRLCSKPFCPVATGPQQICSLLSFQLQKDFFFFAIPSLSFSNMTHCSTALPNLSNTTSSPPFLFWVLLWKRGCLWMLYLWNSEITVNSSNLTVTPDLLGKVESSMQIQIVLISTSTMEKWESTYACSIPTAKICSSHPKPQQQDLPLLFRQSQQGSTTQAYVLRTESPGR